MTLRLTHTNRQLNQFVHVMGIMINTPIGSSGALASCVLVSTSQAMGSGGVVHVHNDERLRRDYDATGERLDTGKLVDGQ